MIPLYGPSGVLPPFVGSDPADRALCSPYAATMTQIVNRFATSVERAAIIRGLLDYRAALAAVGISHGFQWIDGSFVENCEAIRQRPPADVDLVTFAYRPGSVVASQDWKRFVSSNARLFTFSSTKADFKCDAYYIDLNKPAHIAVHDVAYFNSLFSHQRSTFQWKGMVAVDLNSDDAAARSLI